MELLELSWVWVSYSFVYLYFLGLTPTCLRAVSWAQVVLRLPGWVRWMLEPRVLICVVTHRAADPLRSSGSELAFALNNWFCNASPLESYLKRWVRSLATNDLQNMAVNPLRQGRASGGFLRFYSNFVSWGVLWKTHEYFQYLSKITLCLRVGRRLEN